MAVTFAKVLTVLSIFQFVMKVGDEREEATQELLHQHEEQRRQEMNWLLEMEQMQQRSQEPPALPEESLFLSACQHWCFWASAEILLVLFAAFWLPRQRNSDPDSSDTGEPPAELRRRRSEKMRGSDKLDPVKSLDQHPVWMDLQNLGMQEEMTRCI